MDQGSQTTNEYSEQPTDRRYRRFIIIAIILIALAIFLALMAWVWDRNNDPMNRFTAAEKEQIMRNETRPDTKDINALAMSGTDAPEIFNIQKLSVTARIIPVGLTQQGAVDLPSNIFDIGWYKDSKKPGEKGTVVLDGHATGRTKPGLLYEASRLTAGDEIKLTTGRGADYLYTVKSIDVIPAENVALSQVENKLDADEQLSLLTCRPQSATERTSCQNMLAIYAVRK